MPDLHGFLDRYADQHLHVRKQVRLDDVGALTAQVSDTVVFHQIEGYPDWRLVDMLFATRAAQARVLECQPDRVLDRLVDVLRKGPRPLEEVEGAPCQQNVVTGKSVDLGSIPIVTHTDLDPYPYTTSFVVHKDPETGQFNQMFPRCGVLSETEMVASFVSATANQILGKHRSSGTPMPQAIVIGADPAWELAGVYSHPHENWWELELYEAITGRTGRVTRCATVDLVVPADASIVIEGFVHPTRTAQDGPSPGPTMLFTPYASEQPVFEVTAITLRDDPIYRNHQMTPFTDHQELPRLFHEAIIYERLQAHRVGVRDVHFPAGGGALSCIVQLDPSFDGQVTDALLQVMGSTWPNLKMVVAVDPDVDIYDYRDVHYALATRVDPSRDVITVGNARGFPFDPTAVPVTAASPDASKTRFPSVAGKWAIDATKPVRYHERRRDFDRAWPLNWGSVRLEDYVDTMTRPAGV